MNQERLTSETYIKMCEKAEEIQKSFDTTLPPGTFWVRKSEGYYSEGVTGYNYKKLPEWIILPRQDQLQEMVGDESSYLVSHLLLRINEFYSKLNYWGGDAGGITMEQLWLAFAMKERWGKVWSGTDWVKQEVKEH